MVSISASSVGQSGSRGWPIRVPISSGRAAPGLPNGIGSPATGCSVLDETTSKEKVMRFLLINGNTSAFVTERAVEEAQRAVSSGTEIVGVTGETGASIIATRVENALAEREMITLAGSPAGKSSHRTRPIHRTILMQSIHPSSMLVAAWSRTRDRRLSCCWVPSCLASQDAFKARCPCP